tara:strand:- start:799 stop:1017 length:219 start_codon:yes stop_codon:yes gene_type:complete
MLVQRLPLYRRIYKKKTYSLINYVIFVVQIIDFVVQIIDFIVQIIDFVVTFRGVHSRPKYEKSKKESVLGVL